MTSVLALDIGGTKLLAGAVDGDGNVLQRQGGPTPKGDDPEVLWSTVTSLLESVQGSFAGSGGGCGGPMEGRGETVSPLNIPAWRGFPLRSRLEAWSGLPVEIDNDAKALTLGEWWTGSLRGRSAAMAMVVSTGVGGGLILDGRLVRGRHRPARPLGPRYVDPGRDLRPRRARG